MNAGSSLKISRSRRELVEQVTADFYRLMFELCESRPTVHLALTGGTVGIEILTAIRDSPLLTGLDWSKVQFWWGDERWLPTGDAERNDFQAESALLNLLLARDLIADSQVHRFAATDSGLTIDEAAEEMSARLAEFAEAREESPVFDLVFLGVGPDAHIASLFPGKSEIGLAGAKAVPVRNSPKPPPERLSLTLAALNRSERTWLCLAGEDKAAALRLTLSGTGPAEAPAAGVSGQIETRYYADQAAASELPEELLQAGN